MVISDMESESLLLDVRGVTLRVTPQEFDRLCETNPDLRLELSKDGELIVIPPTGGESGKKNLTLAARVWNWNDRTRLGFAFDSSTGYDFIALGGGKMSPDVSWIEKSRLEGINIVGFIKIVPDFVLELRSPSDRIGDLRLKMLEYQRLGVRLGLLINPQDTGVEIYRVGRETEILQSPQEVDCTDVMPDLFLSMAEIW